MYNSCYDGFCYKTNDPEYDSHIRAGQCEPYPKQLSVIKRYLTEFPSRCGTMVDVGACIGTTALPYSRLYKNVIAYEPNLESFKLLRENVKQNNAKNIVIYNKGISDRKFFGISERYGNNSGMVTFKEDADGLVSSCTLDEENIQDVDFLKIDTEGSELLVLKGAEETLKRWKPLIQVEVNGAAERLFGIDSREISIFLTSLGFSLYDTSDEFNPIYYHPGCTR